MLKLSVKLKLETEYFNKSLFLCEYNFQDHENTRLIKWIYYILVMHNILHRDGLVQDCSSPIANILELLQSCTKPSI